MTASLPKAEQKKRTNLLLDDLPESFKGIKFNADFKAVLNFLRASGDEDLNEKEKAQKAAECFFGSSGLPDSEELWDFIGDFISCGEEPEYADSARTFDFEQDAGRIWSAFWQAYGIDLRRAKMHWYLFRQLLDDLPEDTMLLRVIQIRNEKPKKHKTGKGYGEHNRDVSEYNRNLQKLQRRYRIDGGGSDDFGLGLLFSR